jgi:P2 family phage major capsid protein
MQKLTRQKFEAASAHVAALNGVSSAASFFTVEPTIQQRIENLIQENDAFLKAVNFHLVDELKGAKVGIGVSRPIASNTDTNIPGRKRETRDVHALTEDGYECRKNDFDTRIKYETLDAWAKFPDFATRLRNAIVKRQSLDILMMGFNGRQYAKDADFTANQMLEDVNIGWLQKMREAGPEHHVESVEVGGEKEIKNVDALVMDAIHSYLAPWNRQAPGLVVVCSRQFLLRKYYGLINVVQAPTEQVAAKILSARHEIGGLPPVTPPYFPEDAFLITSLDNLSRYSQTSGRRRYLKESPEINAIENFESSNDAYVVEDYDAAVFVEGIQFS